MMQQLSKNLDGTPSQKSISKQICYLILNIGKIWIGFLKDANILKDFCLIISYKIYPYFKINWIFKLYFKFFYESGTRFLFKSNEKCFKWQLDLKYD